MTAASELAALDATAQAGLVASGEVHPRELVAAAIERIERTDPQINAVIQRRFERALDEASGTLPDGPFRGVPFVLKDLWAPSAGDPMHNGVRALQEANYVAPADAWLVERHRRAGLVIVGRTATPELGLTACTEPDTTGPCRNPWNTDHTPGGSSGGSAAAVAAGMVPMAHATDGGGSIRIPASACGLVGLKTSQGRITMGPQRAENALGVENCVTRSVRDTAVLLDATQGPGVGDMVIAPPPLRPYVEELGAPTGSLRIGVLTSSPNGPAVPDAVAAVRAAAALLEGLGHRLSDDHPAAYDELEEISKVFLAMWCVGASQNLDVMAGLIGRPLTADDVEPYTWLLAEMGRRFSGIDYARSLSATVGFRRRMATFWAPVDNGGQGFDLLLTPTLAITPPRIGELKAHPDHPERGALNGAMSTFTASFNITGQPAISLPLHMSTDGLPIGVQLVAAYGREDLLIRVASQLEAAAPWAERRPAVFAG